MNTKQKPKIELTVFALRIIAMATMLCDHIGSKFLSGHLVTLSRCIGRFAFPTYALLLAEGFRHSKDKPGKTERHLGDLMLIAIITEPLYDLYFAPSLTVSGFVAGQSVIFTLLLAYLGLIAINRWKDKPLMMWSAIFLTAAANYLIMSNYKFAGVLLVYALYFYLENMEKMSYIKRTGILFLIFICYLPIYHWARYDFCNLSTYIQQLRGSNKWWYAAHIAIPPVLALYNGNLGYYNKTFKKIFRYFYPAHFVVLGILLLILR